MTNTSDSDPERQQENYQTNRAYDGGTVYSTQNGSQHVNNITNVSGKAARSWAGWAAIAFIVLDVVFFFYGKSAYTGQAGNSGDLWRAGLSLVLLGVTINLIRRWFRHRL
jgi:hypothetical protein